MTRDEIRERGTEICRRLTRDVASIAPAGIGHWDRAWQIVAQPDADFMAALTAWESDPTNPTAKQRVRDCYAAVLEAWRRAVTEYTRHSQEAER